MIEKHLSVANSVVERKTIYRVAPHHWPELLVFKNKNESCKINVLINRTEAILYGNQFVERLTMVDLNGGFAKTTDGTNKYMQTPVVAEKTVSTTIFKDWMKDALSELSFAKRELTQQSSSSVPSVCSKVVECTPSPLIDRDDDNREVIDFFGWAIHYLRGVLSNEFARMQELKWETMYTLEEEEEMIRFIDEMRIFHTEALLDKQYLHECYPSCHQLKNKGWLSLVAKEYFPFAQYLLHQIRSSVNVQEWARRGNGVIESAAKTLEEDKSLAVLFLDDAKSSALHEKMKKKL
jgi:hypothetical protein